MKRTAMHMHDVLPVSPKSYTDMVDGQPTEKRWQNIIILFY